MTEHSTATRRPLDLAAYYADSHVRRRMVEFLGGSDQRAPTCHHLQRTDAGRLQGEPAPASALADFLREGRDVGRSLWDRESLLAHLDIEYINADFPGEALLDPPRAFALQAPAIAAVEAELAEDGISALHLISPRGHHFVWRVPLRSPAYDELVRIGRLPLHMAAVYAQPRPPDGQPVTLRRGLAYAGLALVLEHLAHAVIDRAAPAGGLPITLTDVQVGTGERGRESVSLDLSEYGDPLHTRVVRVPFSAYLKPWHKPGMFPAGDPRPPLLVLVPQADMDTAQALAVRQDLAAAAELAERASVAIPARDEGTRRLIERYRESRLARFHDWFYAAEDHPPERWPATYDRLDLGTLPPCVARRVAQPNPYLLEPAGIQAVVRTLWAMDWHPRHIAGLLRSRYERDHGWGTRWLRYDATVRAEFYTRMFAGLIATGRDGMVDFNCVSEHEKRNCLQPYTGCDEHRWRQRALQRSWP